MQSPPPPPHTHTHTPPPSKVGSPTTDTKIRSNTRYTISRGWRGEQEEEEGYVAARQKYPGSQSLVPDGESGELRQWESIAAREMDGPGQEAVARAACHLEGSNLLC
uniref:Uncharacterized protein n=1 Tax=Zea mays TaxID=4577 RepID=A0A804NQN2_MAIZE